MVGGKRPGDTPLVESSVSLYASMCSRERDEEQPAESLCLSLRNRSQYDTFVLARHTSGYLHVYKEGEMGVSRWVERLDRGELYDQRDLSQ